jgi:hypothetical protein
MLSSVEILARKLTDACSDSFIQPSLLDPPGIKATRIRAGHSARTGQEPQIRSEIAAGLPERSRMEIPSLLTDQRAKIDVHRSPESVPTRKSLFLLALYIPEGIADILKIEFHTAVQQACPLAAPVSEEVAVRALTRFVTVRAGERLLLRSLGMGRKCKYTKTTPE